MSTYYMTAANAEAIIKLATKLSKKVRALGIDRDITVLFHDDKPFYVCYGCVSEQYPTPIENHPVHIVYKVEVHGDDLSWTLNGWKYLGKLIRAATGSDGVSRNLVFMADENVSGNWETADMACSHCNAARNRKSTYIIGHEDGRVIQVGTGCVEEYLGSNTFAAWCNAASKLLETAKELSDDSLEYERYLGKGGQRLHNLVTVLNISAAVINQFGWVSHAIAEERCQVSTSHRVKDLLNAVQCYGKVQDFEVLPEHVAESIKALEWAKNMVPANDFEKNLQTVALSGYVFPQHVGIACSIIQCHRRANEKKATSVNTSEFVGTIGVRQDFTVKCIADKVFNTDFGTMHIYILEDELKNRLVWKTSKNELCQGFQGVLKGTVKDHTVFGQAKQTEIFRCKIVSEIVAESLTATV